MSRARIVDYYKDKLTKPGFEFRQIREELEANNVDEEEIRVIVRIIDNEIQRSALQKSKNGYFSQIVWIGAVITGIGALITIGTFVRALDTGGSYFIAYGPFLGGLSILLTGLARKRK